MCTLKNNTNEFICKTEIDSQIQTTNVRLPKGITGGGSEKLIRSLGLTDAQYYI